MKVRYLAIAAALISWIEFLLPVPANAAALTLSPSTGPVGTEVTTPAPSNYGKGAYYIYWESSSQVLSQGTIETGTVSIGFAVPESTRGKHRVILKIGEETHEREFTIVPTISLSSNQGSVGTSVTVSGKGFDSNESVINVTYDNLPVQTAVRASSKGSWQAIFKIPPSSRGKHAIDAAGSTPAAEVADQTFVAVPQISINPSTGSVGSIISIVGSGFEVGETNLTILYDGLVTKGGITADAKGSWQSTFSIPTSAKGVHMVDAYGATTKEAEVPDVPFTMAPGLKLELASRYLGGAVRPGDTLWVSGIGFEANESGIHVTFDGSMITSNIIADAKGSWSTQIEVPPTTKGEHKVNASGETTKASDLTAGIVVISPTMDIRPTSGAVGDEVVINGSGFGARQVVTISCDGNQVPTASAVATDAKGSFTASIKMPKGKAGDRAITVTDTAASVASAKFTVESTPPPTPKPVAPEAGTQLSSSSFGLGKTTVSFKWSEVQDPSGVLYTLEVSNNASFTGALFHKDGLTQPEYQLTENEALGTGEYYWRVQAIDGAGNKGQWTNGQFFKIGGMNFMLIAVIILVAIVLFLVIRRIVSMKRQGHSWG